MLRCALFVVALIFFPFDSWGADPTETAAQNSHEVPADDPISSALDARDWKTACDLLESKWKEPPEPREAARRALCLFHLKDYAVAAHLASYALEQAAPQELRSYREKLATLFEQTKLRVGVINLELSENDADILLDGHSQQGTRFFVAPGEHQIEVRAAGFASQIRTFSLGAGESVHATIKLKRTPEVSAPRGPQEPGRPTTPLLIGATVGLVGAIAGTTTLILAAGADSNANDLRASILDDGGSCGDGATHANCVSLEDKRRAADTLGTVSAVAYGVGIAGLLGGALWYVVQPESSDVSSRATLTVQLHPERASIGWVGRF